MNEWWAASLFVVRVLDGDFSFSFFIAAGRVLLQRFSKKVRVFLFGVVKFRVLSFGVVKFRNSHSLVISTEKNMLLVL